MAKTDLFITFSVPHLFQQDEKFAVRCNDMEQAKEIASDAHSLDGIKNIRIRKCSRPSNRLILGYNDYWNYAKWY